MAGVDPAQTPDMFVPPTFPDDFIACKDRSFFERTSTAELCESLVGQYLYCHRNGNLVQIAEAEVYSEEHDSSLYQAMFGSPCAQFKTKAGQLIARYPTHEQPAAMTPDAARASMYPLELYITAGMDETCGDVLRLISFLQVEGCEPPYLLEERLGHDNVEGMFIHKEHVAEALGAGGDELDWAPDPFLYQGDGVQLFFLREPRVRKTDVLRGPIYVDEKRVGPEVEGQDKENCFSLDFFGDIMQRI
ncbi:hypothetical protein KC19_10G062800 [Ceratodon purpureus]|uniref:Uncharacterized protein n=1 Tax=Ceratodon purpureus TaxID=3225 RepID=A0A8T0GIQ2_CERPU|nr:hypothetical protein KC19_10G062800 [Ceratodon purpureus]